MKANLDGPQNVLPTRAHEEVSGLRKAITAHLDEPMVASVAAPMMGELLARLEGFASPTDVGELRAPAPPEGREPMSQGEAAAALHDACGSIRERVLSGVDDPQTSGSLQAMVEVIENHLTMKGEVLARSASDAMPG